MIDHETRAAEAMSMYTKGRERLETIPEPKGQKFPVGQRVYITKDLGESMSHFNSDTYATVVGVYSHMYGGDNVESYSLDIDCVGEVSWYEEWQLTAIKE